MRNSAESQLLCTFTSLKDYESVAINILEVHDVDGRGIYVLQNAIDHTKIFLTYNVIFNPNDIKRPKTILVHRKRDFNVIYSINSLNLIVQSQNGNIEIDWSKYRNSLVIVTGQSIEVIPTKLLTILGKN